MKSQGSMIVPGDDLMTLHACGGYYICPEGPNGELLGPLVGYAGTYPDENDRDENGQPKNKQFVGKVYYNFAKAENYPVVLRHYARKLAAAIREAFPKGIDVVMAMPIGGIVVGAMLSEELDCRFIQAEKEVTAVKTATAREQSILKLDRHELEPDDRVLLGEDVCNNFSTTQKGIELVEQAGAEVVGLTCLLNRSQQTTYGFSKVISMLHIPTEQFRQDNPVVAAHVAARQVEWKPKKKTSWPVLMAAMAAAAAKKE